MVGFYTEEVRIGGKRVGFDIVTLGSESRRGILARTNSAVKGTVCAISFVCFYNASITK